MYNKLKFCIISAISLLIILSIVVINSNIYKNDTAIQTYTNNNLNSSSSLSRLMNGNKKYFDASINTSPIDLNTRKLLYKNGQNPYAVILTCADSRVVPENIFYTGLGEIFVLRVAGNVVDDFVMGSIEYAIDNLKVPLIMVMGHEDCGAIFNSSSNNVNGELEELLDEISPSYQKAKALGGSEAEILERATDFNVENSMHIIKENEVIKKYIKSNSVNVVGANYSLQTGKVRLLNN